MSEIILKLDRKYRLAAGHMGNNREPDYSPMHVYRVVGGRRYRGGFGFEMSLEVFFLEDFLGEPAPRKAKDKLISFLREKGYERWLKEKGLVGAL